MATAISPTVLALTTTEQTLLAATAAERLIEFLWLENVGATVPTATIRIKNASNVTVKEFLNIAVSAKDATKPNTGILILWDYFTARRLPAGWYITAVASANSVLTAEVGGVTK